MDVIEYSIGLDVDKETFKACLKAKHTDGSSKVKASKTFNNNTNGFQEADQWIRKHKQHSEAGLKVVMEATGVYHEHLAWKLHHLNYVVYILLPLRARRYMQSLGLKSKNDKIDAEGLATIGIQQELTPWQPCSENLLQLRSLTRQLEMFNDARTAFKNQLEAVSHLAICDKTVIKNLKSLILKIDKDIASLKKTIEQFIHDDSPLEQKYNLVKPIKGFGVITFATLVAETDGFELFENQKQLVSYAGYDVIENQSGKRHGRTRISKQGNTHIRRILHMASLNMVRYRVNPFFETYTRIVDRTKIKMKGIVAVQRKLLCLIYALWKRDSQFNAEYQTKTIFGNEQSEITTLINPQGPEIIVAVASTATLDRLRVIKSPAAFFS